MNREQRRKICYVTGTRADFGLMLSTLQAIHACPELSLNVVVTGMHLSELFGSTVREIEESGLAITARIPVDIEESTGGAMARNLAATLAGCVQAFERDRPDIVLVLGDRGEMLGAALAAIHLNIVVAHLHGGERSGTVDEPVRHAISKLSHYHMAASEDARERLIRMGERADHVFVTGAPGLDGLTAAAAMSRQALCESVGFDPNSKLALFVYHPVLQEAQMSAVEALALLTSCLDEGFQVMALTPNSDAGGADVRKVLLERAQHSRLRVVTHLPRERYVSWMAACDVMVGNSSSGIIEAATFGTPVVNVGTRQNLRLRNLNVMDGQNPSEFRQLVREAAASGRRAATNLYGDGRSGQRIVRLLQQLEISDGVLKKVNSY